MPAEPFCSNPKCDNHKLAAYPRQYETMKYVVSELEYDFDEWEPGKMNPKQIPNLHGKIIKRRLVVVGCKGQLLEGYFCEVCVHALEMVGAI